MQTSNSRIGKENKLSNVLLWQKKKEKKKEFTGMIQLKILE
jgi:hypothetical protein